MRRKLRGWEEILGQVKWGEKERSGYCEEGGAGKGRPWQKISELCI